MKVVLEFNYPEDEDNLKKFVHAVGGREWVGLTEEEMAEIWEEHGWYVTLFQKVEAKLKEKNT